MEKDGDIQLRVREFDEYQLARIGQLATSFVGNRKPDSEDEIKRFEDVDDLRDIVQDDELVRDVVTHAMILAIRMHEFMMAEASRTRRAKLKQERAAKRARNNEQSAINKKIAAVNKITGVKDPAKIEPLSEKVTAEFNQLFTMLSNTAKQRSANHANPD